MRRRSDRRSKTARRGSVEFFFCLFFLLELVLFLDFLFFVGFVVSFLDLFGFSCFLALDGIGLIGLVQGGFGRLGKVGGQCKDEMLIGQKEGG